MTDRSVLMRRRQALQARLHRHDWSRTFRSVAPILCSAGLRFAKRPPSTLKPLLRHVASAPGRDERLFWPEISGSHCAAWTTTEECAAKLIEALNQCTGATSRVVVVFHDAEAGLSLSAADLERAWPLIDAELYATVWVVAAEPARWVIEVSYIDREICYTTDLRAVKTERV